MGKILGLLLLSSGVVYAIGAERLPHFAHRLGRAVGRSVVFARQGKNTLNRAIDVHELHGIRDEVKADMNKLRSLAVEARINPLSVAARCTTRRRDVVFCVLIMSRRAHSYR